MVNETEQEGVIKPPEYWVEAFSGTPVSIMVPSLIRYMQGYSALLHALIFLRQAQFHALHNRDDVSEALNKLENSDELTHVGHTYETLFASQLMINLVSEVEQFLTSCVSATLRLYPEKMGSYKVDLKEVVAMDSKEAIVNKAAQHFINDLMYKKPLEYKDRLSNILSIDLSSIDAEWNKYIEIKARRDIGIHNAWIVNDIYMRKMRESGVTPKVHEGEKVPPDFSYLSSSMETCKSIVNAMANMLGKKWLPLLEDGQG